LDDYLEGWAEANPAKILAATAPDFCFYDPLVGSFVRRTMHEYFEILQDKLSGISAIKLGRRGLIAESVAYDLNLASDVLRRAFEGSCASSR
jgi:hypothetical protein